MNPYSALLALPVAGCLTWAAFGQPTPAVPATPPPKTAPSPSSHPPPPVVEQGTKPEYAAQIALAKAIAECCPIADPADLQARDQAAAKLGSLNALLDATEFHLLWAAFDPAKGIDVETNKYLQLNPLVFAKVYLSMFMFTGKHEVRKEGDSIVIELEAKFRGGLPPGDFAHALWFTPESWNAYAMTESLLFVYSEEDQIGFAYYKAGKTPTKFDAPPWKERWRWGDARGVSQPRVANYDYLFSKDNPHTAALDNAYRALQSGLQTHKCFTCHAPDNKANADMLVLLRYPNQALSARHALAAVLREETMPPGDIRRGVPAGIHDEKARQEMIKQADEFDTQAEAALKFEADHRAKKGEKPKE